MKKILIVCICTLLTGSAISLYVTARTPNATSNLMTANIEALADSELDQCTYQSSVYDYVYGPQGDVRVECYCSRAGTVCCCL